MKSILQSIKPQYCELIASGKKTIEVRKTRPKLDVPFKVYIYCTKDKLLTKSHNNGNIYSSENKYKSALEKAGNLTLSSKVIGEYVCDRIEAFSPSRAPYETDSTITKASCLSIVELIKYSNMDKPLYGWHISNLKIYDKPKELSELYHYCGDNPKCKNCPYLYVESNEDIGTYEQCCSNNEGCKPLTYPPQSWCYVEELQE